MLVLLQGTFTPLVHAHAGRTQHVGADGREISVGMQRMLAAAERNRYAANPRKFSQVRSLDCLGMKGAIASQS